MQNLDELLKLAEFAAKAANNEILKHYSNFQTYIKEDKSPLTTADLAANEVILKILEISQIPVCSEEKILTYAQRKNAKRFWLIDPLDGTKEFIAQNGEFCVCIALIEDGLVILSAIGIPLSGEIYSSKGGGIIYKNGEILKPSDEISNLFLLGRHGNSKKRTDFAKNFGFEFKRLGSAIKFCKVASSQAAAYARFGDSSLWDIAAGGFLVEQSGGVIIDLKTLKTPRFDGENLINNHYLVIDKNHKHKLNEMIEFLKFYK